MTSSFLYIVYVPIKGTLDTLQNERRGLNAHSADMPLIHVAVHCNWFLTEYVWGVILQVPPKETFVNCLNPTEAKQPRRRC